MLAPSDAAALARDLPPQILFGTSTWTYPGWKGIVYDEYPAKATAAQMLKEYARFPLFRTVGIDSFFYRPPDQKTLDAYAAALPPGFRCVSKVWEDITAHTFTSPGARERRGERNPNWLNADLFMEAVLAPMRAHFAGHLGPFVFELSAIPTSAGMGSADLAEHLVSFFDQLPRDVPFAVELRNPELLNGEYLAALAGRNVAHVFNAWTRMPPIAEQLLMHEAVTANFIVARALLTPGRTYQAAVNAFAPYNRIQEPSPALRNDLVALARTAINLRIPAYVIVNNRAEGCAPETVAEVARMLSASKIG